MITFFAGDWRLTKAHLGGHARAPARLHHACGDSPDGTRNSYSTPAGPLTPLRRESAGHCIIHTHPIDIAAHFITPLRRDCGAASLRAAITPLRRDCGALMTCSPPLGGLLQVLRGVEAHLLHHVLLQVAPESSSALRLAEAHWYHR